MTCDGSVFLSFNLKIDSMLSVCIPHDKEVEPPFGVHVKFLLKTALM